jgi:hypothetical protein
MRLLPRGRKRALPVDGATCIVDHDRRESTLRASSAVNEILISAIYAPS